MATNTNAPFGFRPIGRQDGGSPTAGLTRVLIASDNVHSFYAGDPVIPLNTGYVDIATASTVQIAGIFWQCEYLNTSQGRVVWSQSYPTGAATGDVTAYLITDPEQLFVAQSDGLPIVFGDINANIQLQAAAGNALTQQSGFSLHQGTIATDDTLPFRIIDLWSNYAPPGSAGTDNTSNYNWAVVAPNNWSRKQLTSVG
jgi:hypothetical protein